MDAELLIDHANVLTLDPGLPTAQAIAVRDGRVLWVGESAWAKAHLRVERTLDLAGATVAPGFIDAHHHLILLGYWLSQIDCSYPTVRSIDEIAGAVQRRATVTPPGTWIQGRGYDDNKLPGGQRLTRWELDKVSPGHPVYIRHASGHMGVANSNALSLGNVIKGVSDPFGGHVFVDAAGEPTGLLQERAQDLIPLSFVPSSQKELADCIAVAGQAYLAAGVTSGHEAGIFTREEFIAFQDAWATGRLALRTYMMIRNNFLEPALALGLQTGLGDDRLRVGSLKVIGDGSLIGRTAVLSEPFLEGETGFPLFTQDELDDLVWKAHSAGWQVAIHEVGDQGIDMCLTAIERALARLPRSDHRHRIEHCGVLTGKLIRRIAALGVIPVSQPPFILEYGDGFLRHLGKERCQLTYPLRSLLVAGIPVAGGSDSPVCSYRPLVGIKVCMTECTEGGADFAPDEALTFEQALTMYTKNGAYASFDEHRKGTIAPGKYADMVVLGADPRMTPAQIVDSIPVLATIQGGDVVYESPISAAANG
jgi:predicted amidohydrolase YtcJ